ncbi:MAG: hypothetical protein FDX30_08865 [Chlorobium sp.]|nr:MAG: hypothetical protein FDX30_08865 [Chlorobium sp.]
MISIMDAYKNRTEPELELVQASLAELIAKEQKMEDEVHVRYADQIDTFERVIDSAILKLKKVFDAVEGAWVHLKDGLQRTLSSLGSRNS